MSQDAAVEFEIEGIFADRLLDQRYVLARVLTPSPQWTLTDNSQLGGVPIQNWQSIPRDTDAHGHQRLDRYLFKLRDAATEAALRIGQVVELEP